MDLFLMPTCRCNHSKASAPRSSSTSSASGTSSTHHDRGDPRRRWSQLDGSQYQRLNTITAYASSLRSHSSNANTPARCNYYCQPLQDLPPWTYGRFQSEWPERGHCCWIQRTPGNTSGSRRPGQIQSHFRPRLPDSGDVQRGLQCTRPTLRPHHLTQHDVCK